MGHITEQDGRYITYGAHYLNRTGDILHMGHITEQDRRYITHGAHY